MAGMADSVMRRLTKCCGGVSHAGRRASGGGG